MGHSLSLGNSDNKNFCVIGLGSFGKKFSEELGGMHHINTVKGINENNIIYKEIKEICDEIKSSLSNIFFIAISSDGVMGKPGQEIAKTLFEEGKILVNINSTQEASHKQFRKILDEISNNNSGLISLHPMFGPSQMKDGLEKNMIITEEISSSGEGMQKIHNAIKNLQSILSTKKGYRYHNISKTSVVIDDKEFLGSKLHDKVTAYYQAVVHMLRVLSPDDKWFEDLIGGADIKDWNINLSLEIIRQNPYATDVFIRHFKGIETIQNIEKKKEVIIDAVRSSINEANALFGDKNLDFFKTPRFSILEKNV